MDLRNGEARWHMKPVQGSKQITGPWIDELDASQIQPRTGVFSVTPLPGFCDTIPRITGLAPVVIYGRYQTQSSKRIHRPGPIGVDDISILSSV